MLTMTKHRHTLRARNLVPKIFILMVMLVASIFVMMPFYFMFLSSLKPGTEIMRYGLSFKLDFGVSSFANYAAIFTYRDGLYLHWYKSSLIIMLYQTAIGLFLGSLVGYGLAMYRFRGRSAVMFIVLLLLMFPFEILMLPLYQVEISPS